MKPPGSIVALDIGNSSIKLAEFPAPADTPLPLPTRLHRIRTESPAAPELSAWFAAATGPVFYLSVCRPATRLIRAWLAEHRPAVPVREFQSSDYPAEITVKYPQRVGQDRLAAAVAVGRLKSPGRAAICIDAGSAITVDLIAADNRFLGGAILPGWRNMAHTLAVRTDLLPKLDDLALRPASALGKSTEEAIASGLYWGVIGAVRELVARLSALDEPDPQLFVTGGDAPWLASELQATDKQKRGLVVHSEPELALRGLAWLATGWLQGDRSLPRTDP